MLKEENMPATATLILLQDNELLYEEGSGERVELSCFKQFLNVCLLESAFRLYTSAFFVLKKE